MPAPALPPRELRTRAVAACLDEVHAMLAQLWQDALATTPHEQMAFTTALAEVVANVVEHAARFEPVPVRVLLFLRPDLLEAHVEDRGLPYAQQAEESADELAETGRGLTMARALVDEVLYERDGPVNRWVVSLRRSP